MAYSKEKLEFLRNNTILSPFNALKLKSMEKKGIDSQKLLELEYDIRLTSYANRYYKMWKELNWGEKEDENLQSFAEDNIVQHINEKSR